MVHIPRENPLELAPFAGLWTWFYPGPIIVSWAPLPGTLRLSYSDLEGHRSMVFDPVRNAAYLDALKGLVGPWTWAPGSASTG